MSEEVEPINLTPSPSMELSTSSEKTIEEEKEKKSDLENQNLKEIKSTELIYGNDYKIKKPKKIGNSIVLWYIKDWPLLTIGPDCIYLLNLISYKKIL